MAELRVQFIEKTGVNLIEVLDGSQLIMAVNYNSTTNVDGLVEELSTIVRLHNAGKHLDLVDYIQTLDCGTKVAKIFAKDSDYIGCMRLSAKYIAEILSAIVMRDRCDLNVAAQKLYEHALCGEVVRVGLPPAPSRMTLLVADITKYVLGPMLNAVAGDFVPLPFGRAFTVSFFNRGTGTGYVLVGERECERGRYINGEQIVDSCGPASGRYICGDDDDYVMLNGRLYGHNACHYVLPNLPVYFIRVCGGYAYGTTNAGNTVRVRIGRMCNFPCKCCAPVIEPTRVRNPIDSLSHYYYDGQTIYVFYYGADAPHMIVPSRGMRSFGRMPIGDAYYILDSRGVGTIPILH